MLLTSAAATGLLQHHHRVQPLANRRRLRFVLGGALPTDGGARAPDGGCARGSRDLHPAPEGFLPAVAEEALGCRSYASSGRAARRSRRICVRRRLARRIL